MATLFDEWVDLNCVVCSWRLRFDGIRGRLNNCKTRQEAEQALKEESYDVRYPKLPEYLK